MRNFEEPSAPGWPGTEPFGSNQLEARFRCKARAESSRALHCRCRSRRRRLSRRELETARCPGGTATVLLGKSQCGWKRMHVQPCYSARTPALLVLGSKVSPPWWYRAHDASPEPECAVEGVFGVVRTHHEVWCARCRNFTLCPNGSQGSAAIEVHSTLGPGLQASAWSTEHVEIPLKRLKSSPQRHGGGTESEEKEGRCMWSRATPT